MFMFEFQLVVVTVHPITAYVYGMALSFTEICIANCNQSEMSLIKLCINLILIQIFQAIAQYMFN